MRLRWCALFFLLLSCREERDAKPLVNTCRDDFECGGTEDECDIELGMCVRPRADQAYPFVVQALVERDDRRLAARTHGPEQMLSDGGAASDIRVRKTVRYVGSITAVRDPLCEPGEAGVPEDAGPDDAGVGDAGDGGQAGCTPRAVYRCGDPPPDAGLADAGPAIISLQAEVAFFARNEPTYLAQAVSTFTRADPARGEQRFAIDLTPATPHRARVLPLGWQASEFPPVWISDATSTPNPVLEMPYPPLCWLRGWVQPETSTPPRATSKLQGLRVRLRDKGDGSIASSLATLGPQGEYAIRIEESVYQRLAEHELVIDVLPASQPWVATVAIGGESLREQASVTIPDIPPLVGLEVDVSANGLPIAADVTLFADYRTQQVNTLPFGRSWCNLRMPRSTSIRCSGRYTQRIEPGIENVIRSLLPGDYQVLITPRGYPGLAARLKPESVAAVAEEGSVQGPVDWMVERGKTYRGRVRGPDGKAMPRVSIVASPLGLGASEQGLPLNTRTFQTESGGDGAYQLPIEPGGYDLLAVAPEGTGFPAFAHVNRFVSDGGTYDIRISAPVVVRGRVVDEDKVTLFPARIEALALVEGERGRRAVRVASASSDDAGAYMLYMPPRLGDQGALRSMDGGIALDGGGQRLLAGDAGIAAQR